MHAIWRVVEILISPSQFSLARAIHLVRCCRLIRLNVRQPRSIRKYCPSEAYAKSRSTVATHNPHNCATDSILNSRVIYGYVACKLHSSGNFSVQNWMNNKQSFGLCCFSCHSFCFLTAIRLINCLVFEWWLFFVWVSDVGNSKRLFLPFVFILFCLFCLVFILAIRPTIANGTHSTHRMRHWENRFESQNDV